MSTARFLYSFAAISFRIPMGSSKNSRLSICLRFGSTGKSFSRLLQDIRLENACQLLSNTDLSITAICEMTGYNNMEHFSRLFKEAKGVSPTRYRKEIWFSE